MGYSHPSYIVGGRVWVWPCIQRIQKISVTTMTLVVESPRVYTKLGVPISVTGIAQVKIQTQPEMLIKACEMFLNKKEPEIRQIALETLEGHQRAIMGLMTVEEIFQDRKKFAETVFKVAAADLINMGISVVSYTLKDIRDDQIDLTKSIGNVFQSQFIAQNVMYIKRTSTGAWLFPQTYIVALR
uniref:Band 7 domain-containing protein n=1 Tax=Romanomermis culicivorax TaxID=13658 RepID=A0A915KA60_ROMCU